MTQTLPEAGQTLDAAIHRRPRQCVVSIEAGGEAHHFLQPVDHLDATVVLLRDDQVEAVRTKVERGQLALGLWTRGRVE